MKIQILASCAGEFGGNSVSFLPGQSVEVPDDLGADLVKAGYAKAAGGVVKRGRRAKKGAPEKAEAPGAEETR